VEAAWPLWLNLVVFIAAAGAIGFAGTKLAAVADHLADATGLGEAFTGAVLVGASTSLAGITASVTAAAEGHPQLAVSNALGGIAAQTAFLAIADFAHREANLEHAAASLPNIVQGVLLTTLLAMVLLAIGGPEWTVFGVHPMSLALPIVWIFGVRLAQQMREKPMWRPRRTSATRPDIPEPAARRLAPGPLWIRFLIFAAVVAAGGWAVAHTGVGLAQQTGLSESLVGAAFTAIATSLPELVTTVAAVRRGALTLAVGDIIGGNAFDTLFLSVADIPYREGSLYHAASTRETFLCALAVVMNGFLLMGLVRRERAGVARIGFESVIMLALFVMGYVTLALWR